MITTIRKCQSYDYEFDAIIDKLQGCFEDLGGIEKYIEKSDTVLLKINLLSNKKPQDAVTTHPVFTMALAKILTEYGASVIIGDSPAGYYNEKSLDKIYKGTSYAKYVEDSQATLNNNFETTSVANPDGLILKNLELIDIVTSVDKVISVSKLKTHGMMTFTGAVKNMFGAVPGTLKAEYHFRMPDYSDFADMLIDINVNIKPVLSFMDGIVAMEGNGPGSGDPVELGAILASQSPYELDYHAVGLIKLDYNDVPTIKRSIERDLMGIDSNNTVLLGDFEDFNIENFDVPRNNLFSSLNGKFAKFLLYPFAARPIINESLCVKCEICKDACPPKVINMKNSSGFPKISHSQCIKCYCCQELCPVKAIKVHKPILNKVIFK